MENRLIFALVCVVFCGITSCDGGNQSIGHVPAEGYVVYFSSASYPDQYYRYHTAIREVDSLTIPYSSHDGLVLSADGRRLYLTGSDETVVIETDELTVSGAIPYQGRIAVSPDNKLIAVLGPVTRILSASDYSEVFFDSVTTYHGHFSSDSQTLYCVGGPGAVVIHLSGVAPSITTHTFPGIVRWVQPSLDERLLFLYRKITGIWSYDFVVYDIAKDSVIFNQLLIPGAGELTTTPDGRSVLFTNPGSLQNGPGASPYIYVYDIETNRITDSMFTPSPDNGAMLPRLLAVTPDGRTLVASGARGQGEFSVIDLIRGEEVDHHDLGNTEDVWDIACQTQL